MTPENPGLGQPPLEGNFLSRIPLSSLSVTRQRPLFSASRRPPAPARAPPAGANRQVLAARRTRAAALDPARNRDRQAARYRARFRRSDQRLGEAPRRRSRGGLASALGRSSGGDARERHTNRGPISFPPPAAAPTSPTDLASLPSDRPGRRDDARPRAKTGANWISVAHVLY